jgi:hypothetical protein
MGLTDTHRRLMLLTGLRRANRDVSRVLQTRSLMRRHLLRVISHSEILSL